MTSPLSKQELTSILVLTENEQTTLFNSFKIFQKLDVDEDLSISAWSIWLRKIQVSKRPIILDNKRMQIGFNEDEILLF